MEEKLIIDKNQTSNSSITEYRKGRIVTPGMNKPSRLKVIHNILNLFPYYARYLPLKLMEVMCLKGRLYSLKLCNPPQNSAKVGNKEAMDCGEVPSQLIVFSCLLVGSREVVVVDPKREGGEM